MLIIVAGKHKGGYFTTGLAYTYAWLHFDYLSVATNVAITMDDVYVFNVTDYVQLLQANDQEVIDNFYGLTINI